MTTLKGNDMFTIGVRELKSKASEILQRVSQKQEEVIITKHGQPYGKIVPIKKGTQKKEGKSLRAAFSSSPDLTAEDFELAKKVWEGKSSGE